MRRSKQAVKALPIIDLQAEARILAYHTGLEGSEDAAQPRIGVREVQDELSLDLWNALMQGVA